MQFSSLIRPVLVCVLASSASACGMVDSDPNRFETLAGYVADIPVTMERPGEAKARPLPPQPHSSDRHSHLMRGLGHTSRGETTLEEVARVTLQA